MLKVLKYSYVFVILVLFVVFKTHAFAQTTQPNSLSVAPSLLQLDLATDKPEGILYYTNTTSQTLEVQFSASDFAPLEDGYKLSFLSQKDATNYHYTLSSWINFSDKTLLIPPHTTKQETVFIQANKLTPGGHYATILAQLDSPNSQNIHINGILASLLFVRTHTGLEKDEATIRSVHVDSDTLSFPNKVFFRVNNTGDTVLTPFGTVTITDVLGRVVARNSINTDSLQTLPESIREYSVAMTTTNIAYIPGPYSVSINIHMGKKPIQRQVSFYFWSQGQIPYIQGVVVFLLLGLFAFVSHNVLPRKRLEDK